MSIHPLPDERDPARSGRHPVEVGHLVMGLALLGLVGVWAVVQADLVDGDDVRWLLPLPWVLAGTIGLLATTLPGVLRRRRASRTDTPGQPGPHYAEPGEPADDR